jgi:hypothetical protein
MKTIMLNMRDEVISTEEWNALNPRVINGNKVKKLSPLETKYATLYNTKRSDINATVFQNYLKTYHNVNSGFNIPQTAIATNWAKSKIPWSFDQRKVLSKECSELDHKCGTSQMCAPLLHDYSSDVTRWSWRRKMSSKELQTDWYINFENWF